MDKLIVKKPRATVIEEEVNVEDEIEEEENNNVNETTKRNRKFRVEWLKKFPWLENKNGLAYCKACNKSAVNILSHLNRHENSTLHLQNFESKRSQISMDSFLDAEKESMEKMMKNAEYSIVMFLIAHNLPFLLMDYIPGLLADCCPDSEVAKRLKCARTKATKIAEEISSSTTKDLALKLKSCKFSLIIDETTDVALKKCLVLVVRYIANFIPRDRFLALIELPKCDAQSIFGAIKKVFLNNNIPVNNMIGLATDGASVIAGHLSGVKALFESQKGIFYLKCTFHSLHLCVSYACKKLPRNIGYLCRNIYIFFSHSAKRVHDFKEFQDFCSVKPLLLSNFVKKRHKT